MKQVIPAIRPCITYTRQQTGFYMVHQIAREPANLVILEKVSIIRKEVGVGVAITRRQEFVPKSIAA